MKRIIYNKLVCDKIRQILEESGKKAVFEKVDGDTQKDQKPSVYRDFSVNILGLDIIDLFNWQNKVKKMISQLQFVRQVNVQSEAVERYIRERKIIGDMEGSLGDKFVKYEGKFMEKEKFMKMVKTMDMNYS